MNGDVELGTVKGTREAAVEVLDGPIDVVFSDVTCSVRSRNAAPATPDAGYTKDKSANFLTSVSGIARQGRMLALMGATGSGKTTLLSCLAHRVPQGCIVECPTRIAYRCSDHQYYSFGKALKRRVAFVEQDDIIMPELTVRESLMYLARLRLGYMTAANRDAVVQNIIAKVKLEKAAGSLCGQCRGSGHIRGERKRLAIAAELLVKPRVIFLDEATSGLDSATALLIFKEEPSHALRIRKYDSGHVYSSALVAVLPVL